MWATGICNLVPIEADAAIQGAVFRGSTCFVHHQVLSLWLSFWYNALSQDERGWVWPIAWCLPRDQGKK
jgi:hypothetical protein